MKGNAILWACMMVCVVLACSGLQASEAAENEVIIKRDTYGVPHIYADTVYGLFYGYGYAIAQDRLF